MGESFFAGCMLLSYLCKILSKWLPYKTVILLESQAKWTELTVSKIESMLFVPIILTFSKNLRCLNLALTQAQKSVTRHFWWLKKLCIFFILALSKIFWSFLEFFCWQHCSHTGKFKHLKFLENDKIIGTNNIDSILGSVQLEGIF